MTSETSNMHPSSSFQATKTDCVNNQNATLINLLQSCKFDSECVQNTLKSIKEEFSKHENNMTEELADELLLNSGLSEDPGFQQIVNWIGFKKCNTSQTNLSSPDFEEFHNKTKHFCEASVEKNYDLFSMVCKVLDLDNTYLDYIRLLTAYEFLTNFSLYTLHLNETGWYKDKLSTSDIIFHVLKSTHLPNDHNKFGNVLPIYFIISNILEQNLVYGTLDKTSCLTFDLFGGVVHGRKKLAFFSTGGTYSLLLSNNCRFNCFQFPVVSSKILSLKQPSTRPNTQYLDREQDIVELIDLETEETKPESKPSDNSKTTVTGNLVSVEESRSFGSRLQTRSSINHNQTLKQSKEASSTEETKCSNNKETGAICKVKSHENPKICKINKKVQSKTQHKKMKINEEVKKITLKQQRNDDGKIDTCHNCKLKFKSREELLVHYEKSHGG